MYELMESLGERECVANCIGKGGCIREDGCVLRKIWQRIENKINEELKRIKISDIKI